MMTSAKARELILDRFPDVETNDVKELEGNPNILGYFYFIVKNETVYVTSEGEVFFEFTNN